MEKLAQKIKEMYLEFLRENELSSWDYEFNDFLNDIEDYVMEVNYGD